MRSVERMARLDHRGMLMDILRNFTQIIARILYDTRLLQYLVKDMMSDKHRWRD